MALSLIEDSIPSLETLQLYLRVFRLSVTRSEMVYSYPFPTCKDCQQIENPSDGKETWGNSCRTDLQPRLSSFGAIWIMSNRRTKAKAY